MSLPLQQTNILPLSLLQTSWKSQLDPVLNNPMTNMSVLKDIILIDGVTVINHKLGRVMQGWIIVDQQGAASIYRSQPFNKLTLTLTSSALVIVSIGVF